MANWKIKATLHRLMGRLPWPHVWNRLFQQYVTRSIHLTEKRCLSKLASCRAHLEAYQQNSPSPREDFTVFDLGTGWLPVVPVGLALCGARQVWTCDIAPLLSPGRIRETYQQLVNLADRGVLQDQLPVRADRLAAMRQALTSRRLRTVTSLLEPLAVRSLVQDARNLDIPDGACDLIVSVDALNEIPESILAEILTEFRRIVNPQGVLHFRLELADLYSYFDSRLHPLDYLRYEDEQWKRYDSPITPQARHRISDFRRFMTAAGLQVVHEQNRMATPEEFQRIPLATRFRPYDVADLRVTQSWMTLRPLAL